MPPARIVFCTPVLPAAAGNGLAMRAGVFLEGLAIVGPVDVVVVPVFGSPPAGNELVAAHAASWQAHSLADPADRRAAIEALLGTPQGRRRASRVHPLPAVCRGLGESGRRQLEASVVGARLVHVMRSYLLPYVDDLLDADDPPALTVDLDELDSQVMADLGRADEAAAFQRLERHCAERADVLYTASPLDVARLPRTTQPPRPVHVIPNAVRHPTIHADAARSYDLLFVGNLSYEPNVDAVCWFCSEVLPLLDGATIAIVGSRPTHAVRALAELGLVTVAADVPDVGSWYARSRVALAPLRIGGGTRLKIAEALAHRRPVVATSVGASGLPVGEAAGVLIADDAPALARACRALLDDPARAERIAHAGRARVPWVDDVACQIAAYTRAALDRQAAQLGSS